MSCLLPLKSKTSGSSPSPHRAGKKTTQRNNIMQSLPPTPPSLSTKSIEGKSLATLSQKSPPPNLHGRQSLARGYSHSPSFTPRQRPTCCCICQSRQLPAETKCLSPYALPSFCQVPYPTFPPPGPNHPGSGKAGFWNQPAFFTPALARQFLGQLSPPPCLKLWPGETSQAETTRVSAPAQWMVRRGRRVFGLHSQEVGSTSKTCRTSRILTTIHRDTNPNCWIQVMGNPCRSPTSTTSLVGKWSKDT